MSWKTVALGDICEFTRGLTYSKIDEVEFSNNAVLRATNIDLESNKLNLEEIRYINSSVKINEDKKVKLNDILICTASGSKSHLGKVALINEQLDMAFGGFMAVLRVKENIEAKFLFNYLTSDIFLNHISKLADGANINNLKFSQIQNLKINLPPLATQQKIVAKLDAIFAKIDKVTATAKDNSKNSYSLYSSAADVVFDNLDNKYVKLSACADIGYGYTSRSSIEFSGPQYLRITDIQEDNVDWLLVPRIQGKVSEVKKFLLKDGDIVFARTGATTGKSYLIKNPPVSVFASYLIKVDANRNLVLPEYLRHLFRSEGYWNTINSGISGTAQGGFNASKLSELSFPLPDLDKQMKIVVELNRIEMLSITAKKSFDMKVNLLNSLKKSILKQAFNDELVKAA
jgi:type I restriction enzyme S subunit